MIEETPFTNYKVFKSDTVSERMDGMKIGAKIYVKILFFTTELSANFMFKKKRSSRHASVTARFSKTTVTKKLTSWHLKNIDYADVLSATHVVSGITYGATAFFNFEKQFSKTEDIFEMGGSLKKIVEAIPGLSGGTSTSTKESESIKFDYFGDFDTPNLLPRTLDGAVNVIQDITNAENQLRAVPVTLYLTPLHRLNLPKKPIVSIVEMQSETELAIMAFMDKTTRLREQLLTIEDSILAKKCSKFKDGLVEKVEEFKRNESRMTDVIKNSKEDEKGLIEQLEKAELIAPSWVSLLLQEVDAMDEFFETTTGEDKGIPMVFLESDVDYLIKDKRRDIILSKLNFVSKMDKDDPKKNWVSNSTFFRDALRMVNMMVQAKKVEENLEEFEFLIWVDYMQKENQASLELRKASEGGVPEILSPWEEELLPVLERVEVKKGKIVTPQTLPHLSIEYEFTTITVQEGKREKGTKEEKETNEENLKPATNYEVRARYKAPTTGLLGPWSPPNNFKTSVKVKGVKDSSGKLTSVDSADWKLSDNDWLEVELSSPQTANLLVVVAEADQEPSKHDRHAIKVSPGWLPGRGPEEPTTGEEKDLSKDLVLSSRTEAFLVPLAGWPDIDFVKLEAINGVKINIINLA